MRKMQTTAKFAVKSVVTAGAVFLVAIIALSLYESRQARRVVATVTESMNADWGVQIPEDQALRPGSLVLKQGFARLMFKKGAQVLLQAPCRIELRSVNRMYLEKGNVTSQVPPSAQGFTIETPTARVVDFGTEFGVAVDAVGQSEVHVFAGQVGLGRATSPQDSQLQTIRAGRAAILNATGSIWQGSLVVCIKQNVTYPVGLSLA